MEERRVKDLCIAMEALSRIPGEESDKLRRRLREIVKYYVTAMEINTSIKPTPKPQPTSKTTEDDDIPF